MHLLLLPILLQPFGKSSSYGAIWGIWVGMGLGGFQTGWCPSTAQAPRLWLLSVTIGPLWVLP